MIGALVSVLSLNLTLAMVQAGQVAYTLPITGATATTPIKVTSAAHGIPPGRVAHGVVTSVGGTTEANGLWVMGVVDANTLSLYTYSAQGILTNSIGVHAYTGGGQIQIALPDYTILLGRRNLMLASAAATPRLVFVPTGGKKWDFEPYGGAGAPQVRPPAQGTLEQQAQKLQPQLGTEYLTFEVYVSGAANPPAPDFGDFDATQAVVNQLFVCLFDGTGPARAQILREVWPSQLPTAGTQTQRGQQWMGVIEFQSPMTRTPLAFCPPGVSLVETVTPAGGGSADSTTIVIT